MSALRDGQNKARARELRRAMTDAEQHLWRFLRREQLNGAKFRRQVQIGRYYADFACLAAKLVIELDGGQHAEQVAYDEGRSAALESTGFRVLRFWKDEVLLRTDDVLAEIIRVLDSPPP